jgi:hypothetical protein
MGPTCAHKCFDVARAQGVGDRAADTHEHDILGKMSPLVKLTAIFALLSRHSAS